MDCLTADASLCRVHHITRHVSRTDVLQSGLGRFDKLWPACGGTGQCCSKDVIIEAEIIVLCVRWYLRFALSFRNLEEIMAERNLSVDHVGWSDHWSFWQFGYRAVMVTDTALYRYPYYHTRQDTPEKLDYDRMALALTGLAAVTRELASQ
jgi:hypothetical protein